MEYHWCLLCRHEGLAVVYCRDPNINGDYCGLLMNQLQRVQCWWWLLWYPIWMQLTTEDQWRIHSGQLPAIGDYSKVKMDSQWSTAANRKLLENSVVTTVDSRWATVVNCRGGMLIVITAMPIWISSGLLRDSWGFYSGLLWRIGCHWGLLWH